MIVESKLNHLMSEIIYEILIEKYTITFKRKLVIILVI